MVTVFGALDGRGLNREETSCILRVHRDFDRYIRGAVRRRMRDSSDADDIVQECYLKLIRYAGRLVQLDTPQLVRYIGRVVDSCCARYWKSRKPTEELRDDMPDRKAEQDISGRETYWAFCTALEQLSGRDRLLLQMRYEGGLTAEEMGKALGMTAGNVRSALTRARKRVRMKMDGAAGKTGG